MKIRVTISCSVTIILLGMHIAWGQTPSELFARGNDFYRAGKFAEAAKQYQEIINQDVVSAAVYFNLGNAYYRLGNVAQSILAYERAQRLKPDDPDIAHNLQLANFKTVDRIEAVPDLFIVEWMRAYAAYVTYQTAVLGLFIAWVAFFISLAGVYVIRDTGIVRVLRWVVLSAIVVVFVSAGTLAIHSVLPRDNGQGIITASVVTAKSSPDEQSINAFVVHEGLKVKMSDTLGDWVKITLADGKVGWIHTQQCERI